MLRPLWLPRLHRNVYHGSLRRAAARPVHQAVHALGTPFEDRLDLAIGKLRTHPLTPCASAYRWHVSRNKTPCTRPQIRTR